jgi:hypothetical protein
MEAAPGEILAQKEIGELALGKGTIAKEAILPASRKANTTGYTPMGVQIPTPSAAREGTARPRLAGEKIKMGGLAPKQLK